MTAIESPFAAPVAREPKMIKIISFYFVHDGAERGQRLAVDRATAKETDMLGKILGAIAGKRAAERTGKIGGASGAVLGAVAGSAIRRASIPGLIAFTVGGYALKKWKDKRDRAEAKRKSFETPPTGAAA
jgi:hypothetical protein